MGKILGAKRLSRRIITVVFTSLTAIIIYFTYTSYTANIVRSEERVLDKLDALAKTGVLAIDGDLHQLLVSTYTNKDDIMSSDQDSVYLLLHQRLRAIEMSNGINTAVYTLVRPEGADYYEFIVTSSETPYYRHRYQKFPEVLEEKFNEGGTISRFASENGIWLSAFAPIHNNKGEVVAVFHVDQRFDDFISSSRQALYKDLGISLVIFLIIGGIVNFYLRRIVDSEEQDKEELRKSKKTIEVKNRYLSDSINYAKRIQDAIIPNQDSVKEIFHDSFVFFKGKDTVSGDFPWMLSLPHQNTVLMASVDCTGHGVPGALLSIVGHFLLNDVIIGKGVLEPGDILKELHEGVVKSLNQRKQEGLCNDGMDLALVKINRDAKTVEFAGAQRPLFLIHCNELSIIKGSKLPVGGVQYEKRNKAIEYETHKINYKDGDIVIFFSDGYPDQVGGPNQMRFLTKNVGQLALKHCDKPMAEIGDVFKAEFDKWKAGNTQMDDVLVMGIRL
ncbi:MAG: SpoIIE family protein phosphatase [Bacteroidota bacterium]